MCIRDRQRPERDQRGRARRPGQRRPAPGLAGAAVPATPGGPAGRPALGPAAGRTATTAPALGGAATAPGGG
eukprot:681757-Alexandrium_andersonii.AAC.1